MMQKTLNPLLNSTSEFYLKILVFGVCTWKKWGMKETPNRKQWFQSSNTEALQRKHTEVYSA